MKIALVFFGLLGVLSASPLNYDLTDETAVDAFGTFIEPKPEALPNFEEEVAEYSSKSRPPQIHHNTVRSQGPFSGRLVNVLLNTNGAQGVNQQNQILYNINEVRRTAVDDSEEDCD